MKNWPWYGYLLFGLIILGAFYLLYFKPHQAEFKNLQEERINVETEVASLQIKKRQMDKIEAELVNLDATLKELEAIIPNKKETSDILRRIQQLAYDARLNITKFAPKGEIDKEFYSEWPIPIEITGTYHNLGLFFDQLSRFSRLINIENFSIKALSRQSDSSTITANWTAKTYFFHEPGSVPAAQKPARKRT